MEPMEDQDGRRIQKCNKNYARTIQPELNKNNTDTLTTSPAVLSKKKEAIARRRQRYSFSLSRQQHIRTSQQLVRMPCSSPACLHVHILVYIPLVSKGAVVDC
ncbi:unnamed protein product [Parnassius apollo]|uniref:(apollo) hypothetical protein n=1 Tax=Parnassius apollo TaxID=110799 RepID=A0A8S3W0C5_PARAO|nr:unnamed protein product [Parnassius apollo]